MKIKPGNKRQSFWNGEWGKHGSKDEKREANKIQRQFYKNEILKAIKGKHPDEIITKLP